MDSLVLSNLKCNFIYSQKTSSKPLEKYEAEPVTESQTDTATMNQPKDAIIRIDVPGTTKHAERTEQADINILCLDLNPFSFIIQFMFCLVSVFIFYLAYGYFLELLFTNSEVSLYITLVQFLITTALSYIESLIRSRIKRK